MHKAELLALLNRLGVHPSKKLGQNFLIDDNCLAALTRCAAPAAGETILEIGPGTGFLTQRLLAAGSAVTSVEFDSRLAAYLREHFAGEKNFRLIEGDACRVDFAALFPEGADWRCVSNLPYSCASVLLARLTELDNPPKSLHVLLQREMAERLTAAVGTKEYGVLTVRLAFDYQASIARIVPAGVFFPPPEVSSAFLALTRREKTPPRELSARAGRIAGMVFTQRRKQARRILQNNFPQHQLEQIFLDLGIDCSARAENISPEQYLQLAQQLTDAQ